jgi:hypothetical protein
MKPRPLIKIKKRKKNVPFNGFGDSAKQQARQGWRYVAVELNTETWEHVDGFPDFDNSEVLDLLEIHHLAIAPVTSKKDRQLIQIWSNQIASDCYISPPEFLAEIYVTSINEYALNLRANVGRIYHNSCLGDTRIHANSIAHLFEASDLPMPAQVVDVLNKYVTIEHIADGKKVTLRNRLGV